MWIDGINGTYYYQAKIFDEPSRYGIKNGRVSKLVIYDTDGKLCCQYDREWVIKPDNDEVKEVFLKIMDMYK